MSDDEASEDGSSNNDSEKSHRQNSRSVESEELSEELAGGGEVTDVRDAPEEGYMTAPSRNNPDRDSGGDGDKSDADNSEDSDS